jgi:hypothetical protein
MDMDHPAYLRVLLSVWVGLGLGQLVQAVHRLLRHRGRVRWDWIPLTWAAFALLMFVQTWWAYFTLLQAPLWLNLLAFLLPLATFMLLYLICASTLPDVSRAAEGAEIDLTSHYFGQRRYLFGLWAALFGVALVVSGLARDGLRIVGGDGFRIVALVVALVLFLSARRRVHAILTVLSLAALLLYIVLFSLELA